MKVGFYYLCSLPYHKNPETNDSHYPTLNAAPVLSHNFFFLFLSYFHSLSHYGFRWQHHLSLFLTRRGFWRRRRRSSPTTSSPQLVEAFGVYQQHLWRRRKRRGRWQSGVHVRVTLVHRKLWCRCRWGIVRCEGVILGLGKRIGELLLFALDAASEEESG